MKVRVQALKLGFFNRILEGSALDGADPFLKELGLVVVRDWANCQTRIGDPLRKSIRRWTLLLLVLLAHQGVQNGEGMLQVSWRRRLGKRTKTPCGPNLVRKGRRRELPSFIRISRAKDKNNLRRPLCVQESLTGFVSGQSLRPFYSNSKM